jgi:hypothetical protein
MNLSLILSFVSLACVAGLFFYLRQIDNHYKSLTKNIDQKDLMTILNQILKSQDKLALNHDQLQDLVDKTIKNDRSHFQKMGFVRFNPFSDTGGNQSFCLCLLDENDEGLVISSLHSRENTRIYAKPIKQGSSPDQSLSREELEVLKLAQKS